MNFKEPRISSFCSLLVAPVFAVGLMCALLMDPANTAFAQGEGATGLDSAGGAGDDAGTDDVSAPEVESSQVGDGGGSIELTSGGVIVNGREYSAGCALGALTFVTDGALYGHCAGQVVRIELASGEVSRMATDRMPTDFFVRSGAVWVELDRSDAVRFSAAAPSAARVEEPTQDVQTIQAASPAQPRETSEAADDDPIVVLSFTTGIARVSNGDRLSLRESVRFIDAENGDMVVGSVRDFEGEVALVQLNYGESISVGSVGAPSDDAPTGSFAMPNTPDRFRITATLNGAIGVSVDGGGGAGLTVDARYRFPFGLSLRGLIWPIHVNSTGVGFNAHALVGFDMPQFGMSVGMGMMLFSPERDFVDGSVTRGIGTSIAASLRVGSLDGISFEALMTMVHNGDRFQFGGGRGRVSFRLSQRAWVYALAEGDVGARVVAHFGVRYLLRGWSNDNPVFLQFGLGGGFYDYSDTLNEDLIGPSLHVGIETHL